MLRSNAATSGDLFNETMWSPLIEKKISVNTSYSFISSTRIFLGVLVNGNELHKTLQLEAILIAQSILTFSDFTYQHGYTLIFPICNEN